MRAQRDFSALRSKIAELVIAKRFTLKGAAAVLGMGEKTLTYHYYKVRNQIRRQLVEAI